MKVLNQITIIMNKIKFASLTLLLALFIGNFANAQPPEGRERPSPADRAERMVTGLSEKVTLTVDEKTSLKTIFTDYNTEMQKMREDGNRPEMSKMEEVRKKRDVKVKGVLSEEKYQAYTKYMEERMNRRRGGGGPPSQQ